MMLDFLGEADAARAIEKVLDDQKEVWREATVLKDRSALLDGRTFRDPGFAEFLPMIEAILGDPVSRGPGVQVDAGTLVEEENSRREYRLQRDIITEEIQGFLVSVWPGQSKEEKKHKADALQYAFGTRSWTAVCDNDPGRLREGLEQVQEYAEKIRLGETVEL